jgi:hypothetical protein
MFHLLLLCRFDAANTQKLFSSLSPEDQELLPFDVAAIDWMHYLANVHLPGLRRFVLQEQQRQRA